MRPSWPDSLIYRIRRNDGMTEEDLDAYMRFETEDDKDVTTIMRFEESEAVSYTHLDVYKRQVM